VASAERLFASRGVEGVSLRDVSADAGQRNHSAAQYHFGDRAGLIAAVYENRMHLVDARRQALLDVLRADGRGTDVRSLVQALVVPLVDVVATTDGWYGRFLARTRWEPDAWQALFDLPAAASLNVVLRLLDRALAADLPPALRRSRVDQLMTLLVGTIGGWEGAHDRGQRRLPRSVLVSELVSTGLAVLTAPVHEPIGAARA
jgi:AcrR family transcriptional regulator